jgi:uncharacterized protein
MRVNIAGVWLSLAIAFFATGAHAGFDLDKLMRETSASFVRPAYAAFAGQAQKLVTAQKALCDMPANDRLAEARLAFAETVLTWSRAEMFRAGPVAGQNRLERILFYPDRKGTGLKQVQAALAENDRSVTDAQLLASKSVAMQGLGALEYVIFGSGAETLAAPQDPFRCRFGLAIALNVSNIANELTSAWQPGGQVDLDWNSHDETNPFARNDREALNLVLGTIIHGLEQVQDVRIGAFLDLNNGKDKPKAALFWRSRLTMRSIAANLRSLQLMFDISGLDGALPEDEAHVAGSIRFDFNAALEALNSLDLPVDELLNNAKHREKLVFVRYTIGDLIRRFDQDFAVASGLAAGFSFADGD